MTAEEVLEHRIILLEENIKVLDDKVNSFAVSQAATGAKLDNMLVTLGELKESVNGISRRPVQFWDKFSLGILGALAAAVVSAVISGIK